MPIAKEKLLTRRDVSICEGIAGLNEDISSKRAAALLLMNKGQTQSQAAEESGLTIGQIKYLVVSFRKKRLALFDDDLVNKVLSKTFVAVVGATEIKAVEVVESKPAKVKKNKEKKEKKAGKEKKNKAPKTEKAKKKEAKKSKKEKVEKLKKAKKGKKKAKKKK